MEPLIRSASLRGFHDVVRDAGGDPDELLMRHGIDPARLLEEDRLISQTNLDAMLDTAAGELGIADLRLRLAATQDISILDPLAVAIATADGAAEALANASRFLFVHSPALRLRLEPDPQGRRGVVAVTYAKDTTLSPYSPQGTELGLGLLFRIIPLPSRRGPVGPVGPHPAPAPVPDPAVHGVLRHAGDPLRGHHGCPLRLARDPRQDVQRCQPADPRRCRGPLGTIVQRPRAGRAAPRAPTIAATLPSGTATIATLLSVHPRTLQRQLRARDVTFTQLLDEARRELANQYLTTTDLPLGQIASLIGFSEQSTLSHAVNRWFGTHPRRVRASAPALPTGGRVAPSGSSAGS